MARAVLTPSRQLVVGATTVAAALATITMGVWLAATASPRLEPATGRAPIQSAPAALLEAAGNDSLLALPVPESILAVLEASPHPTAAPAAQPSPGGGLAVQPPALPPPPSPPPGANPDPEPDPDPVTEVVKVAEETAEDVEDAVEEVMLEQPLTTTLIQ